MQSGDEERDLRTKRVQLRYASLGLEFGAGIAGFVLLGYWIDSGLKSAPVGLITGSVLGCVGGLYVLIRRSIEMQKEMDAANRRSRGESLIGRGEASKDRDVAGPDEHA